MLLLPFREQVVSRANMQAPYQRIGVLAGHLNAPNEGAQAFGSRDPFLAFGVACLLYP